MKSIEIQDQKYLTYSPTTKLTTKKISQILKTNEEPDDEKSRKLRFNVLSVPKWDMNGMAKQAYKQYYDEKFKIADELKSQANYVDHHTDIP